MKYLLKDGAWVVRDSLRWERNTSILIQDDRIAEIGDAASIQARHGDAMIVDCSDLVLAPGLINSHNHSYEILARGIGKDAPLEEWLRSTIYPYTRILSDDDYYYGALLAAADSFRNGTTALVSQLTNHARFHADAEARAFSEAGIRAQVVRASSTNSTIDASENADPVEEIESTGEFVDRWRDGPLVRGAIGPAGLFSCDPDTLSRLKAMARDLGVKYYIHLSETHQQHRNAVAAGYHGQIDWANRLELLDADTVVAHAVWATDAELRILAASESLVVHNAVSNMLLGSGIAPLIRMIQNGVRVAIATDGPASNDSSDLFAEMKSVLLLHRVAELDPSIIDAKTVFGLATTAGAPIFGLSDSIGCLDPGSKADLIGIHARGNPALQPIFDPVAALVYCGSGRDVELTFVDGTLVYDRGGFPTIPLDDVLEFITTETMAKVQRAVGVS